jgi:DNA polymerase III epsilon subunit-like protein
MRILYFDTETNGLPKVRGGADTDVMNHPSIVEIAWQIYDGEECLKKRTCLLKPDPDIIWNMESAMIHKIFKQTALDQGLSAADVLAEFRTDAMGCDVLISHNLAFDLPVLKCSYLRLDPGATFEWLPAKKLCTMKETTALCKLPFASSKYPRRSGDKDPYKMPKLSELHTHLFGSLGAFDFHNASSDVDCLVKCAQELFRRNIITLS